jgi:hypothetical protein
VTPRAALHGDALTGLHARFPEKYPILLESVGGGAPLGRYDVLLALPGAHLVQAADGSLQGNRQDSEARFLDALDAWVHCVTRVRWHGACVVPSSATASAGTCRCWPKAT